MKIGYCTNIHSGATFEQALANLRTYSLPVKQNVSPDQPMGIGLWFSQTAAFEALQDGNWQRLKEWLDANGLVAHTFNAFPFSDFHQPVVKHLVYQPDWTCQRRLDYTLDVARLQARLMPAGNKATISTVPLGWAVSQPEEYFRRCATLLSEAAHRLADLSESTGVRIRLCLEPEPGCALQTSDQVIQLFSEFLFADPAHENIHRHFLGVCHDVCHAAVMFESQQEVLTRYHEAGIAIGKVQVSSAPELRLGDGDQSIDGLRPFVEPRYLHQTSIYDDTATLFFEDLPQALEQADQHPASTWRTHFHVPVMLDSVDMLSTTKPVINDCLNWFMARNYPSHFEVETYAWDVSPEAIKGGTMVDSIVAELRWLENQFPNLADLNRIH